MHFHPINLSFAYLLKIIKLVQVSLWATQILKFSKTRQKYAKALEYVKYKAVHILTHNMAHIFSPLFVSIDDFWILFVHFIVFLLKLAKINIEINTREYFSWEFSLRELTRWNFRPGSFPRRNSSSAFITKNTLTSIAENN